MKKIITLLTALALTVALCGCESTKTDNPTQDNSSSSIVSSTVDGSDADNAESAAITTAYDLYEKLDQLDCICVGSKIGLNESQTITVEDIKYTLVKDSRFNSVSDIADFRSSIVTSNVDRYSKIESRFIDHNGELYVHVIPISCGFNYNGQVTVSDITENSFNAERPYSNFGATSPVKIKVVLVDGTWKIDSLVYGEVSDTESSDTESTGVLSETEAIATANELFNKINELDHMNAGDYVTVDENQTITVDGSEYTLVTDDRFTTVDGVATFRSGIVTSNVERYASIEKRFVEQDGKLYVRVTPMGCGFPYSGEATVSDITETSFIAERPYDNFGGISKVQIKVILDNGTWKADELTIEQE